MRAFKMTLPCTLFCRAKAGYSGNICSAGSSPEDCCDTRPGPEPLALARGSDAVSPGAEAVNLGSFPEVFFDSEVPGLSNWTLTLVRGRNRRPFCASSTSNWEVARVLLLFPGSVPALLVVCLLPRDFDSSWGRRVTLDTLGCEMGGKGAAGVDEENALATIALTRSNAEPMFQSCETYNQVPTPSTNVSTKTNTPAKIHLRRRCRSRAACFTVISFSSLTLRTASDCDSAERKSRTRWSSAS